MLEYREKEKKSKKFNFRMKETIDARLDELVKNKMIKSKGDLINKLLEDYLDELDNK